MAIQTVRQRVANGIRNINKITTVIYNTEAGDWKTCRLEAEKIVLTTLLKRMDKLESIEDKEVHK